MSQPNQNRGKTSLSNETDNQRSARLEGSKTFNISIVDVISIYHEHFDELKFTAMKDRARRRLSQETPEQRENRLQGMLIFSLEKTPQVAKFSARRLRRSQETPEQRNARLQGFDFCHFRNKFFIFSSNINLL